jgi:hypothetical protein
VGEQNLSFELKFDSGTQSDLKLQAHWEALNEDDLQFADITDAFGFSIPPIPPELDLALSEASLVYDFANSTVMLSATSENYGTASFIALKTQDTKTKTTSASYVFQIMLGFELSLANLPLVGKILTDQRLGEIRNTQAIFASAPLTADAVESLNKMLTEAKVPVLLPVPKNAKGSTIALSKGFNFTAEIELGGAALPLLAGGDAAPVSEKKPDSPPENPSAGNAAWLDVHKSIGPVALERIGVRYEEGRVWLLMDAGFSLAMLAFSLQDLGLGFTIPNRESGDFSITAQLDGMSLSFQTGPLTISGGFLRFNDDYLGEAAVKAAMFSLTALGGYAPAQSSFFIFARLDTPLGGPPYFFVTGLAGGFGINRSLDLPPIETLPTYPLLPQNNTFPTSLEKGNPGTVLEQTLASTEAYIHPKAGEYWLAAGMDVTSFEMVDTAALLTVSFGVSLEIALLGISRVTVPKQAPEPLVYLEIALEARFDPSLGLIAVEGRLTPASFLFSGLCHISGGFAFYIWYSGDYAGEFVVSIGGYNPRFKKPDYYPLVPRVQMIYEIGCLVMKGQAYFALLPHALMAGLEMEATWKAGPISAWFNADMDFLLGWRPFYYEGDAFIHLGASFKAHLLFVTVSITIHVGVDLAVWGPAFGGKAKVDLDIIRFTIYFGSGQAQPDPVSWNEFKTSFLPAAQNRNPSLQAAATSGNTQDHAPGTAHLVMGMIREGLITDLKTKDSSSFFDWIIDPNHFSIASSMVIPSKTAQFNDFKVNTPFKEGTAFTYVGSGEAPPLPTANYSGEEGLTWTENFGVLPMALSSEKFEVVHILQLMCLPAGMDYRKPENYTVPVNEVALAPTLQNVQSALWAAQDPGLNGVRLLSNTLAGLNLSPIIHHPEQTADADLWALLFDTTKNIAACFDNPEIVTSDSFNASLAEQGLALTYTRGQSAITNVDFELSDLTATAVNLERMQVVDSLNSLGFYFDKAAIDVSRLGNYPLWDWPMICVPGEENSATKSA